MSFVHLWVWSSKGFAAPRPLDLGFGPGDIQGRADTLALQEATYHCPFLILLELEGFNLHATACQ
jgi:hypothetical protein